MSHPSKKYRRDGFTIVELLVVVSIIALLIAILLPAIGKARDAARVTQSQGNLRNLAVANDVYASDFNDRQFTACPDDIGMVGGNAGQYNAQIGCLGQQLIGYDYNGGLWGYWCWNGMCPDNVTVPGCTFDYAYPPQGLLSGYNQFFGAFRMPNVKAFAAYVGDRFFDRIYWAPKDVIPYRVAEQMFDIPGEFTDRPPGADSQQVVYSSYIWSPSAMWHPEVSGHCGFRNPRTFVGAFKSPAAGQCKFPDLKTRMIEHHWLQNNESEANPSFIGLDPSWLYSQGYNSAPVHTFFDGHNAVKGVREAIDADTRSKVLFADNNICQNECGGGNNAGCEDGLWNRQMASFFGNSEGYGYNTAYDNLVQTGYHMYTTDGIRGRDFLANEG
jgi:prepilin-type N-terminal cleavage/methylation domain-containing protein